MRHFVHEQAQWLPDYALFMALKQAHGGVAWTQWDAGAGSVTRGAARVAAPTERRHRAPLQGAVRVLRAVSRAAAGVPRSAASG
jgi:hypothetical protein